MYQICFINVLYLIMNLEEIRQDVEFAKKNLILITQNESDLLGDMNLDQEKLKKLLESINLRIWDCFNECPNSWEECLSLLYEALEISEEFKHTYICPASYEWSNDISCTINSIKESMKN